MTQLFRAGVRLASGSIAESVVSQLSINGQVIIEEAELVNADAITIFTRGNLRNVFEFTITKQHNTPGAAVVHWSRHAQDIAGKADLQIVWNFTGETVTTTLLGAGWKAAPQRMGISTITQYSVVGGRVTVTADPESLLIYDGASDPIVRADGDILDGRRAA